ncbi:MAG TPA: NADH-quinone oxidoreductase subunit J, partial [Rectinemataceae bacterium]|nr:NADH-quinone oxidoreductase subunit J [Rectinemataceae bacterium]
MNTAFVVAGLVAIVSTLMVIVQRNAVHALLYLIVSLFALAVTMFLLGAPFVAALEVIVYAGAIMVLFVFVVMMIGAESSRVESRAWIGPSLLGLVLLAELAWVLLLAPTAAAKVGAPVVGVSPKELGIALLGPYLVGVEIAAFLLLAGLVG